MARLVFLLLLLFILFILLFVTLALAEGCEDVPGLVVLPASSGWSCKAPGDGHGSATGSEAAEGSLKVDSMSHLSRPPRRWPPPTASAASARRPRRPRLHRRLSLSDDSSSSSGAEEERGQTEATLPGRRRVLIGRGRVRPTHLLFLRVLGLHLSGLLRGFGGELLKELDTRGVKVALPSSAHQTHSRVTAE